jgi:hypothetical protein
MVRTVNVADAVGEVSFILICEEIVKSVKSIGSLLESNHVNCV